MLHCYRFHLSLPQFHLHVPPSHWSVRDPVQTCPYPRWSGLFLLLPLPLEINPQWSVSTLLCFPPIIYPSHPLSSFIYGMICDDSSYCHKETLKQVPGSLQWLCPTLSTDRWEQANVNIFWRGPWDRADLSWQQMAGKLSDFMDAFIGAEINKKCQAHGRIHMVSSKSNVTSRL